jgi:hypothetical protein
MHATGEPGTPTAPSPTTAATPWPTLTPVSSPSAGGGRWTRVSGSSLVPANPVAASAGDRGVLLLAGGWSPHLGDPCVPPEQGAQGAPAAFYDTLTHEIARVTAGAQLSWYGVAAVGDGRVLVAGGYEPRNLARGPTPRTRLWDSRTGAWTEGPPMHVGRVFASLTSLADGRVMAAGGQVAYEGEDCPEGCETETNTVEIYEPRTNRWAVAAPIDLRMPDTGDSDQLDQVIALADGRVLALGGNGSAALYEPRDDRWTAVTSPAGWSRLALPDGGLVSFGAEFFGDDIDVEVPFAIRFNAPETVRVVARWAPSDGAAIAVLPGGRIFAAGGVGIDEAGTLGVFRATAEVFDVASGAHWPIASMPAVRGSSLAVPLVDGSVLVVGGNDVAETQPATDEEAGNDTPGCVPITYRAVRWIP